jgi:hypothetical protein
MSEETAAAAPSTPTPSEASATAKPSAEPMRDIALLREQTRAWRLRFYASCVAFTFLFAVSILQFTGTFLTCRMLHETRQEIEKLRTDGILREVQRTRETADSVTAKAKEVATLEREVLAASAGMEERARVIDDHLARNGELGEQILRLLRKADRSTIEEIDRLTGPQKPPIVCPDIDREK